MRPRSLGPLLDASGRVVGLALDHREGLDVVAASRGIGPLGAAGTRALAAALVRGVAPAASAVVLDVEDAVILWTGTGAVDAAATADCGPVAMATSAGDALPALIVPLEAPGGLADGDERDTALRPGFGAAEAAALGAAATRLLLPMRPDNVAFVYRQLRTAAQAVAASHAAGLPIVLEPVIYRITAEPPGVFEARRRDLLVVAVAQLASVWPDLLALPFPWAGDRTLYGAADVALEACDGLHDAAAGIPWVLRATDVDEAALVWQLPLAGASGAVGFVAGRTAWADALDGDPAQAESLAARFGRPRLERLAGIAHDACQPARV
jgi:tagatose-1,6-bisphosphate aldolase